MPQTAKKYSSQRGTLIGLMGVQAMVAQADAPSDRHPVQGQRHKKRFPAKTKEGGNRANVKAQKD